MELKAAHTTDIPTIRELAHGIWWAHYPGIIGPEQIEYMLGKMYSAETLEWQILQEGQMYWLLCAGGAPVGFMALSNQGDGRYFLHKFYLEVSEQGKGRGSAAFSALQQQYPNIRELRLTVNRQNFKSINFYFKLGFRIEKCVDIPIGQGFVMDDFQMLWLPKK
ncbi:MAG: GNAT family N-acetyltransferase [Saprospiraceae bacterium]|nr:GNAT family N-acetyltransferase [Saprospiraceae bacterium]